jgi:putative ABC transport system substrate-binding protein
MSRRDFIKLLGSASIVSPLVARAQPTAMPVIGFLSFLSRDEIADRLRAFGRGLSETGFVEGQNVTIDVQSANDDYEQLPALAAQLVQRGVNVIVANTNAAALAAKAATTDIPIVFYIGSDPVQLGLVKSLNRPGSNLTGVFIVTAQEAEQKRLELIHQTLPSAKKVALLINPESPNSNNLAKDVSAAASTLDLEMTILKVENERDLDEAFARYKALQAEALMISSDLSFFRWSKRLAALTIRDAVPAINQWRDFVLAGGLMSYGSSFADSFHQIGIYAGRILRGEKPADLPVQQTTKLDLVVNLRTAKALGISFPLTLLGRADEVIE